MKIVAGAAVGYLTLAELKAVVRRAETLQMPDTSRIGVKTGISIKDHAPVKSISVEDEDG